eukprot:992409_1
MANLAYFLDHHFDIGICHVFLRVQDSPSARYVLSESKYHGKVSPIWVEDWPAFEVNESKASLAAKGKEFDDLLHSRDHFLKESAEQSKKYGIEWIIQLDEDELLYDHAMNNISDIFKGISSDVLEVHFQIYESMTDTSSESVHVHHRFTTNLFYKGSRLGCNSGKSAFRVGSALIQDGSTHFKFPEHYSNPPPRSVYLKEVQAEDSMILHFESSAFIEWVRFFSDYPAVDVSMWPSEFYKNSHHEVDALRDFYLSKKRATPNQVRLDK